MIIVVLVLLLAAAGYGIFRLCKWMSWRMKEDHAFSDFSGSDDTPVHFDADLPAPRFLGGDERPLYEESAKNRWRLLAVRYARDKFIKSMERPVVVETGGGPEEWKEIEEHDRRRKP